jgi:hypothetical protein
MLLYDIYYRNRNFDRNRPLPEKPEKGTLYAQNTNHDNRKYYARFGKWCDK